MDLEALLGIKDICAQKDKDRYLPLGSEEKT